MAGGSHTYKTTRGVTVYKVKKGQVILPAAPKKAPRGTAPKATWVKGTGSSRRLV